MKDRSNPSDRYRYLEKLGEGGAGVVWLVEDSLRPGARLALKELAEASRGKEAGLRSEFSTLAGLKHPNLAEVHDLDLSPASGLPRFTLEYVEGDDLIAAVRREGPALLLDLAAEALRALAFLHDFGIVHRDLKPGNLLVRRRPRLGCRLVLLDFGLALHAADAESVRAGGTLAYLAPEILRGAPSSPRSDLYSLGAVLHEAVFGLPPIPWDGGSLAGFVEAASRGIVSLPVLPGGYPQGLSSWLSELLSADPSLRTAQASEALARLNAACGTAYPAEVPASRAARLASGPPPGRGAEIAKLWESLAAREGPRVAWVCGPQGSGKSRLLRWIARESVLRGWEVSSLPPEVASATGTQRDPDPVAAVLEKLRALAAVKPTIVIVDEVEAAGVRVVRFLERVAREGKGPPLRVLAAIRPAHARNPLVRKLLADVGLVPTLDRVDLEPLSAEGIRALAERATGSTAVSEARVKWLLDASEGNPQRAEALLVEAAWERGGRERAAVSPPHSIAGRLELLSDQGRTWLEALAVLGDGREELIGRLSGLSAAASREAAEEIAAAGLTRERDGRWFPDSRGTSRQVLEQVPEQRRQALHRRAAAVLIETEGADADAWRLALLWGAAGERERAIDGATRAAQQSIRTGDPAEAAERFAFALRHMGRRDQRRRALRLRQAEALEEAGLNQQAARAYGAALVLSKERGERSEALARQAFSLVRAGRYQRGLDAAKSAAKLARASGRREHEARAKRAMGGALSFLGRNEEALPLLRDAAALYQEIGPLRTHAESVETLAACESNLRMPAAEADFLKVLDLLERSGERNRSLKSLIGLAILKRRAGQFDAARKFLLEARSLADDTGNLHLGQIAMSWLAMIATEEGELDVAISLGREAQDQALHLGDFSETYASRSRLAEALIAAGRPAEAAEVLQAPLRVTSEAIRPETLGYHQLVLAHALSLSPGENEDATRTLIEASLQTFRALRQRRPLLLALVYEMERRARREGQDPFDPVQAEFDALAQGAGLALEPEFLIRGSLARAAFLLSRGNAEGAREAAKAAIDCADGTTYLAFRAQARAAHAEALERLGRDDDAARSLEQGRELLQKAAARISDPAVRQSFLDRAVFRRLTEPVPSRPSGDRRLASLYEMIRVLNSETDPDSLLESILDMALRELRAERGMILLRDESRDEFSVCVARNLEEETEKDAETFSRGIVAQAGVGRSVLTLDAGHDERFRDLKSVSLFGIRSLMCVPLRSRGKIIGTVYLDTRKEGALFSQEDLKFLEAFSDHAALALENVRKRAALERENRRLQAAVESRTQLGALVGRAPSMQRVFELIEKMAASDLPVLILGESGTGKELAARAIHTLSPLRRRTFLSENCAAIPETLLESELFGVARGAFTGADKDRPGLFELADGGTLFLDEIGDMTPGMQAWLLRVLQEGELRRVGGEKVIKVKVRLVAATNRDLPREVEAGRFRQDLWYRLQVLVVQLPPLRERPGDIPLLASHLLERISLQRARPAPRVDREVMDLFERYSWPGNVRQLENALQRLALLAGDGAVTRELVESEPELKRMLLASAASPEAVFSLERSERDQIDRALRAADGNRDRAARLLGISRATIYRKIKEYGLS